MKLLKSFLFFSLSLMILSSCQEEMLFEEAAESNPKLNLSDINIQLENGTLHFEKYEDFFLASRIMANMSDDELDNWESEIGFTSTRSLVSQLLSGLDENATTDEKEELVANHSHLLRISGKKIMTLIDNKSYLNISNEDGGFYIGNTLNIVYRSHLIGVEGGDIEKIKKAKYELTTDEKEGIYVSGVTPLKVVNLPIDDSGSGGYGGYGGGSGGSTSSGSAGCGLGTSFSGGWTYHDGDRRVKLDASIGNTTVWALGAHIGRTEVNFIANGQIKRWLSSWTSNNYETSIYIENAKAEFIALDGQQFSESGGASATDAANVTATLYSATVFVANIQDPCLLKIHGEARTRGTNGKKSIINYGY